MDTNIIPSLIEGFMEDTKDERCGVVLLDPAVGTHRVVEVPNRHEQPHKYFRVMTEDLRPLVQPGEGMVAVIHTHTVPGSQEPSYKDVQNIPDGLIGIVVHPKSRSWTAYNKQVGVVAFHDGTKK